MISCFMTYDLFSESGREVAMCACVCVLCYQFLNCGFKVQDVCGCDLINEPCS